MTADQPVLATDAQRRLETAAREILKTDELLDEIARVQTLYGRDSRGSKPTGQGTVARAAHSIAAAATQYALSDDPFNPALMWAITAPHKFLGLELPRSGFGIENPDNVYRQTSVSGDHRYEIRGTKTTAAPMELHFEMRDGLPGTTGMTDEAGKLVATLGGDAIVTDASGHFTISVDARAEGDGPNHLSIPAGGNSFLIVRDLLNDWETELPTSLEIVALDIEQDGSQIDVAAAAKRSAELLRTLAPFWLDYFNRYSYGARPQNFVPAPRVRPGNRGMSTGGHFSLSDEDALVITLDPVGADYLGIQIADPWGVAYEYIHRTSSLNTAQAHKNSDGTYTFVLSREDPGVHNWLDPQGWGEGLIAVRWQSVVDPRPEGAVRASTVVKLDQLDRHLPEGNLPVSTVERDLQQAARATAFYRRYC